MDKSKEVLRQEIIEKTKQYYEQYLKTDKEFLPGDRVNYGGRYFDEREVCNLVESALDFWLTTGRYADEFEKLFAEFMGVKYCSLVNSGSSANLLAFMALTSPKLGARAIKRGDEIITVACGFPTTVAPIIQYGAVPIFVDVVIPSYNIDVNVLVSALSEKTKAVMVAHTLGNPFNLQVVKEFCDKNNLWLVEDNCDALGSRYFFAGEWRYTGTIGDIGTSSFYPPHHMTMGEGGAVYTNNIQLKRIIESFRDWGRDCWCPSGKDDTCKHRFTQQFGELPYGYDHKYVYSHFGYNLKVTDMQAAIGCAQLDKLPHIIKARQDNWQYLREGLADLSDYLVLPEAEMNSQPSWFGFLISVRADAPFNREEIVAHLEKHNIQTRMLFAGNLLKHPCFDEMRATGDGYRIVGELANTDFVMNNTFWIGVYPGMSQAKNDYMIEKINEFVNAKKS
ncbi:MAG: lipopolysaccharide biosynthesis protein RfbH [Negativicutes bacterium]